jgi:hypothetical protein
MKFKTITGIMLSLLLTGMLTLAFDIQLAKADPEALRVDNLIVTTYDLEAPAIRFAQWKNSCGIPSKVLNVTWIYSHYSGVDEPEKIRNCIIDFHSNFQTKYVTIFGDVDKVPIRYAYIPDSHTGETYVPTDLYYADLNYTWDDNSDGLYADLDNDIVDGVPDVYVGRIPPSFTYTAEDAVTKIMEYQQSFNVSEDWVDRVVLAAGMDGEITTLISDYISGVVGDKNVIKLYESAGNLTNHALDYEIDRGCIFLNYAGHSGESWLGPWLPDAWLLRWLIPYIEYEKYTYQDALDRTNGRKLPVIVTMSCVSAKVDEEAGECLGEYFVLNPNGGAIAYFGSTRVAYGGSPYGFMTEIDRRVFEALYNNHTRLGDMWGVALTEYLQYDRLDTYYEGYGYLDEKTVMEFILLGDPTLRIFNGPETLEVPEDYATIQGAINSAYDGDTIFVKAGTYDENITIYKSLRLIGQNRENTIIQGSGGGFLVNVTSSDVSIEGFTIRNGHHAIHCNSPQHEYLRNITIRNNNITENNCGIIISYPNGCRVENNLIARNRGAIFLAGVPGKLGADNIIVYNIITHQEWESIGVSFCSNTTVIGNTISYNEGTKYYQAGLSLWYSANTHVYHNNFIGNVHQVYLNESYSSIWDDGYPSGGNYWSDHNPPDIYNGLYQNETGRDKIGDIPYIIDKNNTDRYPLIYPFGYVPDSDINDDGIVDIVDIVIVALAFGSEPGDPNWNPYADLNQDGLIDIVDLVIIAIHFGEHV